MLRESFSAEALQASPRADPDVICCKKGSGIVWFAKKFLDWITTVNSVRKSFSPEPVRVAVGGGFIGGHPAASLKSLGCGKIRRSAPKGGNDRNTDNPLSKQHFDWAPEIRLRDGPEKTYAWIYNEIVSRAQTQ